MTENNETKTKNDEFELIKVKDDDGNDVELKLIEIVTVNGKDYALLASSDEHEHCCEDDECECDDGIVLMRVLKEDDNFTFLAIEDDKEFEEVVKILDDEYLDEDEDK